MNYSQLQVLTLVENCCKMLNKRIDCFGLAIYSYPHTSTKHIVFDSACDFSNLQKDSGGFSPYSYYFTLDLIIDPSNFTRCKSSWSFSVPSKRVLKLTFSDTLRWFSSSVISLQSVSSRLCLSSAFLKLYVVVSVHSLLYQGIPENSATDCKIQFWNMPQV